MDFFKKPSLEDQIRQNERETKRNQRGIERDRMQLEREEKKIEAEIKKLAKAGNREACTVLAKQLVQIRKQKTQSYSVGAKLTAINTQQKVMHSNMKMGNALKGTTAVMGKMNKQMDPQKTMQMMQQFEKANAQMDMTEDMMNDALSGIFDDDEAAEDAVVNQVLDEIGVEISGKMSDAPMAGSSSLGAQKSKAKATNSETELEDQLARLRAL